MMLSGPPARWECPNCDVRNVTPDFAPRFHQCAGMAGLQAPMILEGTKAKVERRDREDYVAGEGVTVDANGRPVMSIVTTRDDGQDCMVFAPVAKGKMRSL